MKIIDLRSDTFTKPSPAMRAAMAAAEVGDDVWGEDPTVNELEAEVADVLGKESALFVPSGTMGNLVSVLAHCQRGDEVIVGDEAHIFYYEVAGISALGGVQVHTVPNHNGSIDPSDVERAIRASDLHFPRTALICIENTHLRGGGRAITLEQTKAIAAVAHRHGAPVHLDGSRLFNAAVALNQSAATLSAEADSVNICFSKGLGAPVGSAIAGTRDFIHRARKFRQMSGGGMRQAGVIAAPALMALREGPKRLHEDHASAKLFAQALADNGLFDIDLNGVQTNIVPFRVKGAARRAQLGENDEGFVTKWHEAGVLVSMFGGGLFRAVTHLDVSRDDVLEAARRLTAATHQI